MKSKAHRNGLIHLVHLCFIQPSHVLPEPLFVNGADLLQQDHRILAQAHTASCDVDMCRESCLSRLACDGCGNDRRGMAVAGIILDDQNRSGTPLLTAHNGREIRVKYISPFH